MSTWAGRSPPRTGDKTAAPQGSRPQLPTAREGDNALVGVIWIRRSANGCPADHEGSRRTILNAGGVCGRTTHEPNEKVDLERHWMS